jgi:PPM family protein phosphatase
MLIFEKDFSGAQIPGTRSYQEDSHCFAVLDRSCDGVNSNDLDSSQESEAKVGTLLVVLADGMGGENSGDFASRCVVETFVDYCYHYSHANEESTMLRSALMASNEALAMAIVKNPALEGMGTTLLAAVITEQKLHWVSVGDSPLYLYYNATLSQLNEDHSMRPILKAKLKNGEIEEQDLAKHPDRNLLRSALTGEKIELIDCPLEAMALQPGDIIIVASDGIQTLDDAAIKTRLDRHKGLDAEGITKKLLKAVVNEQNPKQDNTSINVIRIPLSEDDQESELDMESNSKTRLILRK